jgi:NDP-sugar pyrophosphorylase family protein
VTVEQGARTWRAGVIAAGWGERLRTGASTLKPLVRVGGLALVDRVLGSLAETSPSEVVIIVNAASVAVKMHVASRRWPFAVRWIVETTPSSMHSFLRVIETLAEDGDTGPFLVSTVDTIAPPGAFGAFAAASRKIDADVALAIAPPAEDEKPLLVRVSSDGVGVEAMGSSVAPGDANVFATAGYYAIRSTVLREADSARREGLPALRAFFERLLARGYSFAAVRVAGGIDVDRPADVGAAEAFLRRVGM